MCLHCFALTYKQKWDFGVEQLFFTTPTVWKHDLFYFKSYCKMIDYLKGSIVKFKLNFENASESIRETI